MHVAVTALTPQQAHQSITQSDGFLEASLDTPVCAFPLRTDMGVFFWESVLPTQTTYALDFTESTLKLSFILEGEGSSSATGQDTLPRRRGLVELRHFPSTRGIYALNGQQKHKWIDLVFTPTFLDVALPGERESLPRVIQELVAGKRKTIEPVSNEMTPEVFVAASQLANCPYTNAARTLYLKSRTLELLAHVLADIAPTPCHTHLSSYEIECLNQARKLLISDLENPIGIRQLARSVGLSESKLKSGFKVVFGQTVYGYFKAHRMDLSRQMLLETETTVSDVASRVGYSNMSHFSAAFKQRHGVTPSRYRKNNIFFTLKPTS